MEELRNVASVPGDSGHMCINMEWGAFGDDGSLSMLGTCFDASVDQASINPGKQRYGLGPGRGGLGWGERLMGSSVAWACTHLPSNRFEKMISGMYLGEIVRHILLHLTSLGVLFRGQKTQCLQTRDIFKTKFLSEIERYLRGKAVCFWGGGEYDGCLWFPYSGGGNRRNLERKSEGVNSLFCSFLAPVTAWPCVRSEPSWRTWG